MTVCYRVQEMAVSIAARRGRYDILRLLIDAGASIDGDAVRNAVWKRNGKIVDFLLTAGAPVELSVLATAALRGVPTPLLRGLLTVLKPRPEDTYYAISQAAICGRGLPIIRELERYCATTAAGSPTINGFDPSSSMLNASRKGHIRTLHHLWTRYSPNAHILPLCTEYAALHNRSRMVKYLVSIASDPLQSTGWLLPFAAYGGSVRTVFFIVRKGEYGSGHLAEALFHATQRPGSTSHRLVTKILLTVNEGDLEPVETYSPDYEAFRFFNREKRRWGDISGLYRGLVGYLEDL